MRVCITPALGFTSILWAEVFFDTLLLGIITLVLPSSLLFSSPEHDQAVDKSPPSYRVTKCLPRRLNISQTSMPYCKESIVVRVS